jgi:hypothetical protein
MYKQFKDDIRDLASTLATEHYPEEGLNEFHITLSNQEYAALNQPLFDEHGDLIYDPLGNVEMRQRKVIPVKPIRPMANVGAAALAFYKEDSAVAASVAVAKTILKTTILNACGPTIIADLSTQLPGGLASQTIPMIIQYLETKFGVLKSEDMRHLRAMLATKFTTPALFTAEAARFKLNLTALEIGGDNMSQAQLIEVFEDATRAVTGIPEILARYKRHVPIAANRILQDIFTAVENELPQLTMTDAKYVNNLQQVEEDSNEMHENVAFAVSNNSTASVTELIKKVNLRLENMEVTLRNAGRGNPNFRGGQGAGRGRADGRGPGRGGAGSGRGPGTATSAERPTLYCFEHGFNKSHAGKDCHRMDSDTTYTADMKAATGPCKIGGYEGRK